VDDKSASGEARRLVEECCGAEDSPVKRSLGTILAVNAGSSSIRFAAFESAGLLRKVLTGKLDRIGMQGTTLTVTGSSGEARVPLQGAGTNHSAAAGFLLSWLERQSLLDGVKAVGHRVVHGMRHSEPERITSRLLKELHRITPFAPDHLPRELGIVETFLARHPRLPQVACFDTAFHRTMPSVAKLLPIPARFSEKGVERYGFHGLSYAYLMEALAQLDPQAAKGRVILAHLGNGSSLAAVYRGKSIDTSMGFTPVAGLVMSSRTGDLDPGLVYYLARNERMTAARFQKMINQESGLLGVSGSSSDLRDLLASNASRAAAAVELYCYQAAKWIGSFAAVLDGVDTLVFAAGIGENSPAIRERICRRLGFLGVALDSKRNTANAAVISRARARVRVRVIHTDEELMIARSVARIVSLGAARKASP
jgi:acetate kinase